MTRRIKRKKSEDGICKGCGRLSGDRKKPRCRRCPGQTVADTMYTEPVTGIRLLCVDTSTKLCGVSVNSPYAKNKLELAVTVDAFTEDPDLICKQIVTLSDQENVPCWMVIEDPGVGGPRANPTLILGMGQAIGIWRRSWIMAGGGDSRCLMVRQVIWVAGMCPHLQSRDRKARKKESMRQAPVIWGKHHGYGSEIRWTEDLADAAMINSFMLRWPEFVDTIGPQDRKRAEAAWNNE